MSYRDGDKFEENQKSLAEQFTDSERATCEAVNRVLPDVGLCKCIEVATGEKHTMLILIDFDDEGSVVSISPLAVLDEKVLRRYEPPEGFNKTIDVSYDLPN